MKKELNQTGINALRGFDRQSEESKKKNFLLCSQLLRVSFWGNSIFSQLLFDGKFVGDVAGNVNNLVP